VSSVISPSLSAGLSPAFLPPCSADSLWQG
jgi:hypothetical protein